VHEPVRQAVERRPLRWLETSHRIHHLFNGEPFGMLLPVVPSSLRARATTVVRDPLVGS
jgi:hypothetical protein